MIKLQNNFWMPTNMVEIPNDEFPKCVNRGNLDTVPFGFKTMHRDEIAGRIKSRIIDNLPLSKQFWAAVRILFYN